MLKKYIVFQNLSLVAQSVKISPAIAKDWLEHGKSSFDPWVRKIPWRRRWQPPPVFLPGESRGQRSLVGYTVHGVAKLDTTEKLNHNHGSVSPFSWF